jgi:hypothetical protein
MTTFTIPNTTTGQIYVSASGASGGGVLSGTNGTWGTTTAQTQFNGGSGSAVMTIPHGENTVRIEDNATLEVKGRVKINGEWLDERLERIETLLHIPTRDVTMESKYKKLKDLWEQYTTALEQYKTWETLKDSK